MKLYSAHFHADDSRKAGRPPVLIKEGLCWPCLLFGWVGLLLLGSWVPALLAGAVSVALAALLHGVTGGWPVFVGWRLLIVLFGNDWRRWELGLRGLRTGALVAGRDRDTALLRLLDRQPELIGTRP